MSILDDPSTAKKIDGSGMLSFVGDLPEMLLRAKELSLGVQLPKIKDIHQIIISGMGGSAIGGDILNTLARDKIAIPIMVNRSYSLPLSATSKTLLFTISYSGNTEETLSVFEKAREVGCRVVGITSGGKLKDLASDSEYPLVLIPSGIPPRAALPYLLSPLLILLERLGIAKDMVKEIDETVVLLKDLRKKYALEEPQSTNPAKQLALKLSNQIPLIFASTSTTEAVGLRWKTQLNENSKMTALYNLFPELNHNEIVNLAELKKGGHRFSLVILRDKEDHPRIKRRIDVTRALLEAKMEVVEIWSQGESRLARLMSLIYFGDYLSVYLALLQGVDPTPVKTIERLKKELAI